MAASNPLDGYTVDPRPSATSAANCSVPSASWPSPTARCGPPTRAAASPHRARRLAALHRPARGHALWRRRRRRRRCRAGPLYARHAAQRPGLRRRRQHPDLQLRHRPAGNHGPRRAHPHADRQHRRPAHRQGQFRAARYQGPRLAHRLDAGEPMDPGAGRPRARRLRRGARRWPHPRGGRRISLHQRNPARRPRAMAVHRGNHRPAHHPHAAGRVPARRSQAGRPRDLRPRPPGRPARRHRVRRARQSVGHADHGGPAYRAHAPGRHAFAAGRRRRRGQRQPDAALRRGHAAQRGHAARARAIAPWMASITFGGPDLRTVYLGSLFGTRIPCFRSPVPGLPMAHWPRAGR